MEHTNADRMINERLELAQIDEAGMNAEFNQALKSLSSISSRADGVANMATDPKEKAKYKKVAANFHKAHSLIQGDRAAVKGL